MLCRSFSVSLLAYLACQVVRNKETMSPSLIICSAILCLCWVLSEAELQRFQHAVKEDGSLSLLVVGDWGRRGSYNQSQVALQVQFLLFHLQTSTRLYSNRLSLYLFIFIFLPPLFCLYLLILGRQIYTLLFFFCKIIPYLYVFLLKIHYLYVIHQEWQLMITDKIQRNTGLMILMKTNPTQYRETLRTYIHVYV